MTFAPQGFRVLNEDSRPRVPLRNDARLTLILVKTTGEASYARTRGDKDAMIARLKDGDLLLMAWTGNHYSDVFLLSREDVERYYK